MNDTSQTSNVPKELNETTISKKFTDFHVTLDKFLASMVISYCRYEAIAFQFQEFNAIRLENLELSNGISGFQQNNIVYLKLYDRV